MLAALLLILTPAEALTPPVGWTPLGPDRAVLVRNDPSRGELREIRIPGDNLDPQALALMLTAAGEHTRVLSRDGDGTVNLEVGSYLVGRALMSPQPGSVTWYVVLASQTHSQNLDSDALLTALVPRLLPVSLPGGEVEVMEAGHDGSLWDPVAGDQPTTQQPFDPWGVPTQGDDAQWSPSTRLVGIWGGAMDGPWGDQELVMSLDANGRVRVEERDAGAAQVTEGTWGVSSGQLRIASYTGEPVVSEYTADSKSLSFSWKGQPVTLVRRR